MMNPKNETIHFSLVFIYSHFILFSFFHLIRLFIFWETYHETAYWMVAMILFMQTRDLDSASFSFCTHVVNVARA